jgi:hypothetical protein
MKQIICLAFLLLGLSVPMWACDACGCSASSQYLGILPQFNWNFVGFQYQYNSFSASTPSPFENKPKEVSGEYYNTVQVWGRYNIGKNYQVFAFIPYRYNLHRGTDTNTTNSGIGDASFLVNRVFIRKENSSYKQLLLAGGGVKLPTGSNVGISTLDRLGLPNMQAGTGSWDLTLNANYTISHKSSGLNFDAAYTFTTANKYDYKYGNRLNAGMLVFHSFHTKGFTLLPLVGMRYEYSLHDYDSYSRKWLNDQSGGYICYATAEFQAYYKHLGLRVAYHLPVAYDYGAGYITPGAKTETSFFITY